MFRHCFFLLLISTRTAMELLGPLTLACMSVASLLRVLPLLLCARPWSLLLIRVLCSVVSSSLQPCGLWPARLLCPWGLSRREYCSGLPCPPHICIYIHIHLSIYRYIYIVRADLCCCMAETNKTL